MVSGNKAELKIERILGHAEGSLAKAFDKDIREQDEDENMPSSTHDDTSRDSEDESSESEGGTGDSYVEHSFHVLFIDEEDIPQVM